MCSVPIDQLAFEKSRWLAEVSAALDAARDALFSLELPPRDHIAVGELYLSIEAAQAEVRALRRSRSLIPKSISPITD